MPYKPKQHHDDIRFRILRHLQDTPESSQRDIAKTLGISLGGVNYCLNALVEKGHVKIKNFKASNKKLKYAYFLTPKGIATKTALTGKFLQRKLAEYDALKAEIESIRNDENTE